MPPEAKNAPPSIYENMGKMEAKKPPMAGPGPGMSPGGEGGPGGMEEKKKIVTTLTSVLTKWEALEKDPKGKEIIQQMADSVKKYQSEVLKEGGMGAADKPAPGGAPEPPPPPTGGEKGDQGEKVAA